METIEFWKMSGSGNDFLLIDNREGQIREADMGRFVRRVCRRRESVGADGLIFVTRSSRFDFAWKYFNADGGEAEMCGNGGRCVARFAFLKGIAGVQMTFQTLACGTGAMASALVASARGMVTSPVKVKTRGGEELHIHFEKEEGAFSRVWLEGNTSLIYQGQLHEEAV